MPLNAPIAPIVMSSHRANARNVKINKGTKRRPTTFMLGSEFFFLFSVLPLHESTLLTGRTLDRHVRAVPRIGVASPSLGSAAWKAPSESVGDSDRKSGSSFDSRREFRIARGFEGRLIYLSIICFHRVRSRVGSCLHEATAYRPGSPAGRHEIRERSA